MARSVMPSCRFRNSPASPQHDEFTNFSIRVTSCDLKELLPNWSPKGTIVYIVVDEFLHCWEIENTLKLLGQHCSLIVCIIRSSYLKQLRMQNKMYFATPSSACFIINWLHELLILVETAVLSAFGQRLCSFCASPMQPVYGLLCQFASRSTLCSSMAATGTSRVLNELATRRNRALALKQCLQTTIFPLQYTSTACLRYVLEIHVRW